MGSTQDFGAYIMGFTTVWGLQELGRTRVKRIERDED